MSSHIIDVGADGRDASGETYEDYASADAVRRGLLINRPVLFRYPNGRLKEGNQVRVTEAGLTHLAMTQGSAGQRNP